MDAIPPVPPDKTSPAQTPIQASDDLTFERSLHAQHFIARAGDGPSSSEGAAMQQARLDMVWGAVGTHADGTQSFADWLRSDASVPRSESELRDFADHTTLNCYEWAALAAMRAGTVEKGAVAAWHDRLVTGARPDEYDKKNALIFGDNPQSTINFTMLTRGDEPAKVVDIMGTDAAKPGDFITFDGAAHVAVVVGHDDNGRLVIASHPRIVFDAAALPERAMPAEAFVGTLDDFINENVASLHVNGGANLFKGITIKVGTPDFD